MIDIEYTLTGDDTTDVDLVRFVEPFPAAVAVDLFCGRLAVVLRLALQMRRPGGTSQTFVTRQSLVTRECVRLDLPLTASDAGTPAEALGATRYRSVDDQLPFERSSNLTIRCWRQAIRNRRRGSLDPMVNEG